MSKELVEAVQNLLAKRRAPPRRNELSSPWSKESKQGLENQKRQLVGFWDFQVATRKARMGVNPKTGAKIRIKASKTVKFVPGKAFKELL